MIKRTLAVSVACLIALMMSACVVSPRTGLVCPPGTHPGPHGHRCFAD